MVNLHLKQRALARLRYRPEPSGTYATGTYIVPNNDFEFYEQPNQVIGPPVHFQMEIQEDQARHIRNQRWSLVIYLAMCGWVSFVLWLLYRHANLFTKGHP